MLVLGGVIERFLETVVHLGLRWRCISSSLWRVGTLDSRTCVSRETRAWTRTWQSWPLTGRHWCPLRRLSYNKRPRRPLTPSVGEMWAVSACMDNQGGKCQRYCSWKDSNRQNSPPGPCGGIGGENGACEKYAAGMATPGIAGCAGNGLGLAPCACGWKRYGLPMAPGG
jgi:hypothetical protein